MCGDALDAAQKLGEKIEIVHASSEAEIDIAFDTLRGVRAGVLLVQPGKAFSTLALIVLTSPATGALADTGNIWILTPR